MNQYLFDITLPDHLTEEFVSLIPLQRAHIDSLMVKGLVTSYGLAFDRSKLWVTLLAESEHAAHQTLSTFPLYRFFRATLYPMAFHNMSLSLTKVSLN